MSIQTSTADQIHLPDAPAIPGLSFRRFRGPSDYPHMVAVLAASKVADRIERTDTVEELAQNYAHLSNCDPYEDMLFVEVDGTVVGYTRVTWYHETNGPRIYVNIGFLMPAWRRKGIGSAMLRFNEWRLRAIAAGHPDDAPRFFQAWAEETTVASRALLEQSGYSIIRAGYDMLRPTLEDLPDAPLPAGLEVRPVRPEHFRAIWEADQEAFQDHWGHSPGTEADYQNVFHNPKHDPSLWRVAWDGDEVAGQVRSFIDAQENAEYGRKRGYTEFISVRRPWRKRGLARALIVQSFQALKERGMTEAALGLDAENTSGALRVYESCGFQVTKTSYVYRKPMA